MMRNIRIVGTLKGLKDCKGAWEQASGVLVIFSAFIRMDITWVCLFCRNSLSYTFIIILNTSLHMLRFNLLKLFKNFQIIWFQNLPVFTRFITLDKIQIFFKSRFPHLCIWDNACSFFKWLLWGLSEVSQVNSTVFAI